MGMFSVPWGAFWLLRTSVSREFPEIHIVPCHPMSSYGGLCVLCAECHCEVPADGWHPPPHSQVVRACDSSFLWKRCLAHPSPSLAKILDSVSSTHGSHWSCLTCRSCCLCLLATPEWKMEAKLPWMPPQHHHIQPLNNYLLREGRGSATAEALAQLRISLSSS